MIGIDLETMNDSVKMSFFSSAIRIPDAVNSHVELFAFRAVFLEITGFHTEFDTNWLRAAEGLIPGNTVDILTVNLVD